MTRIRFYYAACFVLNVGGVARANDSMAGGTLTDLVPLQTKQVRMAAEDILIAADGEDWVVVADYTFENLSTRDVSASVGFPEAACEEPGQPYVADPDTPCDPERMRFRQMQTTVEGTAVAHRKGAVTVHHPWARHLGAVWLYDVRFPAKQQIHITHRYRVGQGVNSGGTVFGSYVTRTGALWAGSIGHARFRIHVPVGAHSANVWLEGTDLSLKKQLVDVGGRRVGELLLEADDWNPTRDLQFDFNARYLGSAAEDLTDFHQRQEMSRTSGNPRCSEAGVNALLAIMREQSESPVPVQPTSETIERLVSQGFGMPDVCRDFIYALHGRRFDMHGRNLYFYGLAGYVPGSWPFGYMEPNPEYSDALITENDKAGFRLIDAMVKRLAPCEPCKPCEPAKPAAAVSSGCGVARDRQDEAPWWLLLALALTAIRRAARYPWMR